MIDVNYDGSCKSPFHPGLSQRKEGDHMVTILGEATNLPVGSFTEWCEACETWIEVEVTGPTYL